MTEECFCIKNKKLIEEKAKRSDGLVSAEKTNKKKKRVWENDIFEVGYSIQMTDLGASLLL